MKEIIGVFVLFFGAISVWAQSDQKIKISYVKMGDGLYDFYAENPNFYPMQLELKFTEFENMQADCDLPFVATIRPGKYKVFNLKRTFVELPGAFKYNYTTRVGAFPTEPDTNLIYQLPVEKGSSTKAIGFDFINSRTPWEIVWGFAMDKNSVVYACREGIVCQLDKVQFRDSSRIVDNTLTILHPDQTFGKYELFADSSFMVHLGDTIKAGDPLGKVGVTKFTKVPHVRFSVYYVNVRIDVINAQRLRNIYSYINPKFTDRKGNQFFLKNDVEYEK